MAAYLDPNDPAHMSAADRFAEVAAILARGVSRLRLRSALPSQSHSNLSCVSHRPDGLDVSPPSWTHGDTVVDGPSNPENRSDR